MNGLLPPQQKIRTPTERQQMTTVELLHETLSKEQELKNKKRDKLTRLTQSFSRSLSVLSSRVINVHVVDEQKNAPAWSGASDVFFNLNQVRDEFDGQSLLSLQGLAFHEFAHVRYTPRNGSEICRWVIDEDKWQAFNALEDMRIEGLLVSRYPSIVNWLTATVLDYLVREENAITTLFALVRGRRYLPVELRALARQNYAVQEDITELCDVVDKYRTLLFPEDTEVAKELITRYHELLNHLPIIDNGNQNGGGSGEGKTITVRIYDPNGHADRPTQGVESSNSRPATKVEQQQDRDNLSKQDKADEGVQVVIAKEQTPPQKQSPADSAPTTEQPQSQSQSPTNENSDSDDEFDFDDDEFDFNDNESDSPVSQSGGNGVSKGTTTDDEKSPTDVIQTMLDDLLNGLSKELDRLSIQANGTPLLEGNNSKEPLRADYSEKSVSPDLFLVSKSFARELERLRAKHDPAWNKQVDSGRFNVNRYLSGDSFDTLFDEWSEGRDDVTAIEAVILLDYSGSMSGDNATHAYQSMWAIKKALEQVNAKTTVVLFDEEARLLYRADEKAGTTVRDGGTNGGTDPEKALLYAQNVLANSEQPIKLLFTITDGMWGEAKVSETVVRTMKQSGVVTCQAMISDYGIDKEYLENNRHEFELLTHVRTAKDVLTLGKDLVRLAIARQLVTR